MKKFIIPIMMLLPLTLQAQTVLTEQQQLEEAQKQLEAAKKALQIAKMKAEAARLKAQTDSLNQEAAKAEAEAKQMEAKKAEIKQAETQKAEAEPAPNLPKEEAVTKGGWAIPTTVAKNQYDCCQCVIVVQLGPDNNADDSQEHECDVEVVAYLQHIVLVAVG